jgi:methylenetetrahydrofolate dehydrogenase (NADP+)/methenyltetrahydrofolate cyclohydrolase
MRLRIIYYALEDKEGVDMGTVLSGREVASSKKERIIRQVEALRLKGIKPLLNIAMVGNREDAVAYAKNAQRALANCGIGCRVTEFPADIAQQQLIEGISAIDSDNSVHGILVMRPLPDHIDWDAVTKVVSPAKDVDCITSNNLSGVFEGRRDVYYPCTAQAVIDTLEHYGVDLDGKEAVVIGRSLVIGRPVSMMLLQRNATVTICHSKTTNLADVTRRADVLVVAVGKPAMIKAEHVKQGAVVVDVGINVHDGKLMGDVDFDGVKDKASMITPVPGGIGTVTTSVLMEHVVGTGHHPVFVERYII